MKVANSITFENIFTHTSIFESFSEIISIVPFNDI